MRTTLLTITAAIFIAGSSNYGLAAATDVPKVVAEQPDAGSSELETKGDLARIHSNYAAAVDYYRLALRQDPKNSRLYNKLGIAELKDDRTRAAKSDFVRSSRLDPQYASPLNNLGAVACMEKKYTAATKYLKQALALDESNPSFHVNLGEAWLGLEQLDRAMAEYSRALELDGDIFTESSTGGSSVKLRTPEQRAVASYLIAKMYAKRGNLEAALEQLRRAKEDHYRAISNVYKDTEFASLWNDPRLNKLVPR